MLILLFDGVVPKQAVPEPALQTISAGKCIQSIAHTATSNALSQLTDHRKPYKNLRPSEMKQR